MLHAANAILYILRPGHTFAPSIVSEDVKHILNSNGIVAPWQMSRSKSWRRRSGNSQ